MCLLGLQRCYAFQPCGWPIHGRRCFNEFHRPALKVGPHVQSHGSVRPWDNRAYGAAEPIERRKIRHLVFEDSDAPLKVLLLVKHDVAISSEPKFGPNAIDLISALPIEVSASDGMSCPK